MALSTFVGTFRSLTTDTAGVTTYTLTPGFQAKAGIVFWTGRGDASDAAGGGTHRTSIGFFTSTTNRFCCGKMSADAAAAGSGNSGARNDAVVACWTADTTTLDGRIDVTSITSTQVTFRVEDVMPVNATIGVILFGGSDITNATVVEFTSGAAGTGTVDITTVGFQGDVLFIMGNDSIVNAPTADATRIELAFGACTGTGDEHSYWGGSDQGSAAADTGAYCLAGEVWTMGQGAINSPVAQTNRMEFSAWLSNGFQLNRLVHGRTGVRGYALVIKGGRWAVGNFATRNTTGTIVESGLGFQPSGLLVSSAVRAQDTSPNSTIDDILSLGVTDGTNHHAQGMLDDDGPANMEVATAIDFDKVYVGLGLGDTVDGHIDFTSFDSDGFTLTQNDADPSAYFAWYVACGSAAAAAGAFPFLRRDMRIVPLI